MPAKNAMKSAWSPRNGYFRGHRNASGIPGLTKAQVSPIVRTRNISRRTRLVPPGIPTDLKREVDQILEAILYLYTESRRLTKELARAVHLTGPQLTVLKMLEGVGTSRSPSCPSASARRTAPSRGSSTGSSARGWSSARARPRTGGWSRSG